MSQSPKILQRKKVVGFDLDGTTKQQAVNLTVGGGKRYHSLILRMQVDDVDATPAQMEKLESIELKFVAGEYSRGKWNNIWKDTIIEDYNGKELFQQNEDEGHYVTNGYIDLHFTDWLAKTEVQQSITAIGTQDIKTLTFKAKFAKNHGLTNPTVELIEVYDEINEPIGLYKVHEKHELNVTKTGKSEFNQTTYPILNSGSLQSIYINSSDITEMDFKIDGWEAWDVERADLEHIRKFVNKAQPNKTTKNTTDKSYMLDFASNNPMSGMPTHGQNFQLNITVTKTFNGNIYFTYVRGEDAKRMGMMNGLGR